MTTPAELYLPRVKPLYATAEDLVVALGCKIVVDEGFFYDSREVLGRPPDPNTVLFSDGAIRVHRKDLRPWDMDGVVHEALHWALGPKSLKDEGAMMPIQLGLVRRIARDEDRQACLKCFREYGFDPHESALFGIDEVVEAYKSKWVRNKAWQKQVQKAKDEGWPPTGRIYKKHVWMTANVQ